MSSTLFELVTEALADAGVDYSGKTWNECLDLYAKLGLPPDVQGDSDWDAFTERGIGDT
jgi:hypothetical protein